MRELWQRRITFLVIPSAQRASWRACLSLRLIVTVAAAWAGLTLICLLLGVRLVDYGMLQADNYSLRARLSSLATEMASSRAELDAAREADKQVRALLRLPALPEAPSPKGRRPVAPPAAAGNGSGGPSAADQALLQGLLKAAPPARSGADPLRQNLDELRRLSRQRVASYQEISRHLAWRRRTLQATPSGWPAAGRITSRYGYRFTPMRWRDDDDDESGYREFHPGLDIANAKGTPILATAEGVVVKARRCGGYGNLVMLRHDLGYASLYGHTSRIYVKEGDRVKRGQVIAAMGSTGRSTGSHVHYEVWWNGKTVNPTRFLQVVQTP